MTESIQNKKNCIKRYPVVLQMKMMLIHPTQLSYRIQIQNNSFSIHANNMEIQNNPNENFRYEKIKFRSAQ